MEPDRVTKAVLLDAMGTLVRLRPPVPPLQARLRALGIHRSDAEVARAVRAEIAHYRAHLQRGSDAAGLAELRRECADLVARELRTEEDLLDALLASLRFEPFDDVVPALEAWRARGVRLIVVSNWDVSLHDALAAAGLSGYLDGVVASAQVGLAKPDPEIFRRGLAMAGVPARQALHVGDEVEHDVAGARAAGIEAVLIDRGGAGAPAGVRVVRSLRALTYSASG